MTKDSDRADRLAAALRANLRRRKAPDRVLDDRDAPPDGAGDAPTPPRPR
jgi:hypothetical protein